MMAEIADLAVLDANNTGRFPEGQLVPTLNNGGRALEGILARAEKDRNGSIGSSGNGAAYTILTNAAYASHAAGMWFLWKAHVVNTGAATLTVNALTAKPLRRHGGAALAAGDLAANQMVHAVYNSSGDYYECIGVGDGAPSAPSYTVAGLPTGAAGRIAYASNGRKNGEGSASGTGVLVFHDGTAWRAVDTGATVAA
jgi:hypothetical protein